MTHFYSQVKIQNVVNRNQIQELLHTFQDVIMEHFGLQLVTETYEEKVDFIRAQKYINFLKKKYARENAFSVPFEVQIQLPNPPMCIFTDFGGKAERCYVETQQVKALRKVQNNT